MNITDAQKLWDLHGALINAMLEAELKMVNGDLDDEEQAEVRRWAALDKQIMADLQRRHPGFMADRT